MAPELLKRRLMKKFFRYAQYAMVSATAWVALSSAVAIAKVDHSVIASDVIKVGMNIERLNQPEVLVHSGSIVIQGGHLITENQIGAKQAYCRIELRHGQNSLSAGNMPINMKGFDYENGSFLMGFEGDPVVSHVICASGKTGSLPSLNQVLENLKNFILFPESIIEAAQPRS